MTDRQKALLDKKLGEEYEGKGFNFWAVTVVRNFMTSEKAPSSDTDIKD